MGLDSILGALNSTGQPWACPGHDDVAAAEAGAAAEV